MSNKTLFKKILYFLGIEDDVPPEEEEHKPYPMRPEPKPGRVINIHQASKNKMVIFKPIAFEEVKEITDEVKNRRAAIVNLERLETANAKRILDFMAGSIYALNGTVKKIGPGIFIFAPDNIDISGVDIDDDVDRPGPTLVSK